MQVLIRKIPSQMGDIYQKKVPSSKVPAWQEWRAIGPKPVFDSWLKSVNEDKHIQIIYV